MALALPLLYDPFYLALLLITPLLRKLISAIFEENDLLLPGATQLYLILHIVAKDLLRTHFFTLAFLNLGLFFA